MSVAHPEPFAPAPSVRASVDPFGLIDSPRRLVTIAEFAELIGVSRRAVRRIFWHGRVRFAKANGRRLFDCEAAIAAVAAEVGSR